MNREKKELPGVSDSVPVTYPGSIVLAAFLVVSR